MHDHDRFDPRHLPDAHLLDTARLDQHLLFSTNALRALVDAAQPTHHDIVADLGAGTGLIASDLYDRHLPTRIYAIEIDRRFGPYLERLRCRTGPHVELIWGDILACRLPDVTKVVANPPFRITEQLVSWLHRLPALTAATLIMGHSFGVSATAAPGSSHYNRLSLKVQARFAVYVVRTLAGADFYPTARSPACILQFVPKRSPAVDKIVDAALAHHGGMKTKDLLWHLQRRGYVLGPPERRRHVITELRQSNVVRHIYQRRLQQITSLQLSQFMAELRRLTDSSD